MSHSKPPQNDLVVVKSGRPWPNGLTFPVFTCASLGAAKASTEGFYSAIQSGTVSAAAFRCILKRMGGDDAVFFGAAAGVLVMTKYASELVFHNRDWINYAIAGAVTVVLASATENILDKNKCVTSMDRIVGGAIFGVAYIVHDRIRGK